MLKIVLSLCAFSGMLVVPASANAKASHHHHHKHHKSHSVFAHYRHHVYVARSTAYCQRGLMADGQNTHRNSVASNRHPLGTRLRLVGHSFQSHKVFVVRDRIGWGSELDFWTPSCGSASLWGRRTVRYRIAK